MNLEQMDRMLARRLNDVPGDRWASDDRLEALNQAIYGIQAAINSVNDRAFVWVDNRTVTEGERHYSLPANLSHLFRVEWKGVGDTSYSRLKPRDYLLQEDERSSDSSSETDPTYARLGDKIILSWDPTAAEAALSSPIRIVYSPLLSVADPLDVPALHLGLHLLIVVEAQLILLGETGEPPEQVADVHRRLTSRIPLYYDWSSEHQEQLWIDTRYLEQ